VHHGPQDYDSFLATLAGVTGTVVALLLGFAGAYYVFLRDRAAQFDDDIAQRKIVIRDTLTQLRAAWSMPPSLPADVPPDFDSQVRKTYPTQPVPDMLGRIAADLMFDNPPLASLVATQLTGNYGGPWKGRIYYWLLARTVDVLTERDPSLHSFPRVPPSPTVPARAFPIDAAGPGLAEWCATYSTIRDWVHFFLLYRAEYEADYLSFSAGRYPGKQSVGLNREFKTSVEAFFGAIATLDKEVDAIDRATLLREQYSTRRLRLTSLFVIVAVAALTGMVVPLAFLALPSIAVKPSGAVTLLVVTSGALVLCCARLAFDVAKGPERKSKAYIAERWYKPLLAVAETQAEGVRRIGMIDGGACDDALRSRDSAVLPADLIRVLREFVRGGDRLNRATSALNDRVVSELKADKEMSALFGPPRGEGGPLLSTLGIADAELFEEWRRGYVRAGLGGIPVEAQGPTWSIAKGFIAGPKTEQEKRHLVEMLGRVHDRIAVSQELKAFQHARAHALEALQRLRDELGTLLSRE
jgi:hypothetical protein